MPCINYDSIQDFLENMDECTVQGLRADIARVLFDICENSILGNAPVQRNKNASTIVLAAAVLGQYDISETTMTEIPSGSLVGNTVVVENEGLHNIFGIVTFNTAAVENRYLSVRVNGVEVYNQSGSGDSQIEFDIYRRLSSGDIVTFFGFSQGGVNSGLLFELSFLTQS